MKWQLAFLIFFCIFRLTCSAADFSVVSLLNENGQIHNWTEKEELCLIDVRGGMEDKFQGTKSHETLWLQIQKKLADKGMKVSVSQIINKWKNLKKRYKEVIDSNSKTGNESVSWKHYDKFNDLFGNKASTRVEASFDTTGESQIKENQQSTCSSSTSCNVSVNSGSKTGKKKGTKRKSTELVEMIEKNQQNAEDSLKEIKDNNRKQLDRLDRFLDIYTIFFLKFLYERSIKDSTENQQ